VAAALILSADLMFASRLLSSLTQAGHEAELIGSGEALRERLAGAPDDDFAVLVADLTDDRFDGAATLESLRAENLLGSLRTLAFFSHVETAVRERALQAGFDLVVPRSRMAREAAALIDGLLAG
jgi:DNA-binding NarL/FixJ family response regulator